MGSNTFPISPDHLELHTLDIFCGKSDRDAVWLDAVVGLQNAKLRMQELYAEEPGDYFIFDTQSRTILERMQTVQTEPLDSIGKPAKFGAA